MNKYHVIIVEDEENARNKLKTILSKFHPDIKVMAECEDFDSACSVLEENQIDGVFLDISLSLGGSTTEGFDLAKRMSSVKPTPWIIFITGDSKKLENAVTAHNFRPFGYILKPYDDSHIDKAMQEVRKAFPLSEKSIRVTYIELRIGGDGHIERIRRTRYLHKNEIKYVYAEDGAAINVYLQTGEVLKDVNIILKDWLKLSLSGFVQIRRNTIVNLMYVSGYCVDPEREGCYLVQFKNGTELPIGGTFFHAFVEALENQKN